MPDQLFPLGRTVMTTNLRDKLQESNPEGWEEELQRFIARHASGDWGEVEEEDKRENQLSQKRCFRILSAYDTTSLRKRSYIPALQYKAIAYTTNE